MIFWRRKKNIAEQETEDQDDQLLHPPGEPALELPTDNEDEPDGQSLHNLEGDRPEHITQDYDDTPAPDHDEWDDLEEAQELQDDSLEGGWLSRLTGGLSKSSRKISQGISDLLVKRKLDQETLDSLEELLIIADLGPATAARVIEDFAKDRFNKEIGEEELKQALAESIAKFLEPVAKPLYVEKPDGGPFTILITGVNGVGKTTTIGKLAQTYHMHDQKTVLMAAGDTFRAAAVEQLQIWADRTHVQFYGKDIGADSASVAFESYEKALQDNTDILMIDTAGRLHNKANLMEELQKITRVLQKQNSDLPHEVLLVLDATTGQNAIAQVETFKEMVNVTGLIVTKLDGSARGGIVVALAEQFKLPIYAVGVGEQAEDLQPFHAHEFAKSLVGIN